MAEPATERSGITIGPAPDYPVSVTLPTEVLRHEISDEQLERLADMRRDYLWEGMWVTLGIMLGVAPACFVAIISSYGGDVDIPLTKGELAQIIIFFASLVGFGILSWVMKSKSRIARNLVKEIRERPKRRVSGGTR